MNNISAIIDCVACGSCVNICPKSAIEMDESGLFYLPVVHADKCIQCGLCFSHCPVNTADVGQPPSKVLAAFGGWSSDGRVVLQSSSGGAFHAFAEHVLINGGVVFGARFSEDCSKVEYASSDNANLAELQKSKYVESAVGKTFLDVQNELQSGRTVLFCGTPCHIAGLKHFLGAEPENLITCDFACGGLSSHRIFQSHLHALEERYHSKAVRVDFRPKTYGWRRYAIRIRFANGKIYDRLGTEDAFLRSFLYSKNLIRDNCLHCRFSDCHMSDITIADFWLCDKLATLKNEDGMSLILCNSEKGLGLFKSVQSVFSFEQLEVQKAAYNNKKTVTTPEAVIRRDRFLSMYQQVGLQKACAAFLPRSFRDKCKSSLIRILFRKKGGIQ